MKVSVVLFASYREAVASSSVEIDLPGGATVGDLVREMADRYPALPQDHGRIVAAVNEEYRPHDFPLTSGDEVALIPPVSGGGHCVVANTLPSLAKSMSPASREHSDLKATVIGKAMRRKPKKP